MLLGGCAWLCYGSGKDSSGDMQVERVRENVLWRFYPQCSFLCYHGSVRRNRDMWLSLCGDPWEDQEVVLCFTYTPVFTDSLIK